MVAMKRIQADFILILVALIWGFAFPAQRFAAPIVGIWWFNGMRFLLAAITLLPLLIKRKRTSAIKNSGMVILTSLVLASASGLQQAGLQFTSAANAGFITTLYVVLVPILGLVFFRQKTRPIAWVAALLAAIGAMLLSLGGNGIHFMRGDILEFLGAVLWGFYFILIDRVVKKVDVVVLAVIQYFIVGVIQIPIGLLVEPFSLSLLHEVWWALAYTGIVSVAIGYTLQATAQRSAPPVDVAIILSLESVFAALGGYFLLGEILGPLQIVGSVIIFVSVIMVQLPVFGTEKPQLSREG
jgi:drug/metabolite transporter (DMT)-like permease